MSEPTQGWWDLFHQWMSGAGVILGAGVIYGIRWGLSDWKNRHSEDAKAERIENKLLRERNLKSLNREDRELDRAWARVDKLEADKEEITRDRDRGWDLGRGWFDVAHTERDARNAERRAAGLPLLESLPGFEDLEGRGPD